MSVLNQDKTTFESKRPYWVGQKYSFTPRNGNSEDKLRDESQLVKYRVPVGTDKATVQKYHLQTPSEILKRQKERCRRRESEENGGHGIMKHKLAGSVYKSSYSHLRTIHYEREPDSKVQKKQQSKVILEAGNRKTNLRKFYVADLKSECKLPKSAVWEPGQVCKTVNILWHGDGMEPISRSFTKSEIAEKSKIAETSASIYYIWNPHAKENIKRTVTVKPIVLRRKQTARAINNSAHTEPCTSSQSDLGQKTKSTTSTDGNVGVSNSPDEKSQLQDFDGQRFETDKLNAEVRLSFDRLKTVFKGGNNASMDKPQSSAIVKSKVDKASTEKSQLWPIVQKKVEKGWFSKVNTFLEVLNKKKVHDSDAYEKEEGSGKVCTATETPEKPAPLENYDLQELGARDRDTTKNDEFSGEIQERNTGFVFDGEDKATDEGPSLPDDGSEQHVTDTDQRVLKGVNPEDEVHNDQKQLTKSFEQNRLTCTSAEKKESDAERISAADIDAEQEETTQEVHQEFQVSFERPTHMTDVDHTEQESNTCLEVLAKKHSEPSTAECQYLQRAGEFSQPDTALTQDNTGPPCSLDAVPYGQLEVKSTAQDDYREQSFMECVEIDGNGGNLERRSCNLKVIGWRNLLKKIGLSIGVTAIISGAVYVSYINADIFINLVQTMLAGESKVEDEPDKHFLLEMIDNMFPFLHPEEIIESETEESFFGKILDGVTRMLPNGGVAVEPEPEIETFCLWKMADQLKFGFMDFVDHVKMFIVYYVQQI